MHPEATKPNPRTGLYRLVAVGLISMAASLTAFAQAVSTQPAPATDQSTKAQPAVTTTTTTTTTAPASTEQPIVLNEFTVNGSYAGSLEMAAQLKQSSNAIVEVIAPEDIGKLPDVSIADDLVRLTGLTSERVNGRNQEITIRGLDPDFNVGTLDGVEQATTGDNRDVQYDQYPSALVGGVTVYKTGQADLIGGIGGTVDLQTTSPLSFDHRVIALDAYYNWTQLGQLTPGPKGDRREITPPPTLTSSLNGTEGVFVGYAHRENPYEGQQFQSWGYPTDPERQPHPGRHEDLRPERSPQERLRRRRDREQAERLHPQQARPSAPIRTRTSCCAAWRSRWRNGAPRSLQPGYTVTNGLITNYTTAT
jgi:hypothetical protein